MNCASARESTSIRVAGEGGAPADLLANCCGSCHENLLSAHPASRPLAVASTLPPSDYSVVWSQSTIVVRAILRLAVSASEMHIHT